MTFFANKSKLLDLNLLDNVTYCKTAFLQFVPSRPLHVVSNLLQKHLILNATNPILNPAFDI